jgi:hypothetical protein
MTRESMNKADFYTSIVLMTFGIAAIVLAFQMPGMGEDDQNPYSSPGLLPSILGMIIAGLGLIMFVRSIFRTKGHVGISVQSFKSVLVDIGTFRILATIVLCVLYALLLGRLFFPVLTFLFVFTFVVFFEYDLKTSFKLQIKKVIIAAVMAIITSVSIWLVFTHLFLVRLP